ncbi:MAG: Uncharacterized protein G01um101433_192 [Parcubacteria group bacterium Gr01-1014_33]|nr:MAG: Uncharacterized protein G01um101433_192 [Parcubacteria group bacterium Gr01-1014_33]
MKILIFPQDIPRSKNWFGHPHFFKPEYLEKIKKAAGKNAHIFVAFSDKEAHMHVPHADIIAGFPMTIPPLTGAKNLKWLHSFSAGMDKILTPETAKLLILISNSSGIHATPIAEHLIGFMLIFTRGFYQTFKNQQKRIWRKDETISELRGKTVCIVGLGDIGLETARLAHAFGARVLAVTRSQKQKPQFVDELKTGAYLDKMLPHADFIAICLPHTNETHHLFGIKKFKLMKSSAVIMNIGRGGIINEKDLIQALRKKIVGGAGLDVTEEEPLPKTNPLWNMENVIITPHHSGLSEKYMDRAIALFCANLKLFLRGKRLLTVVDKEKGY